MPVKARRHKIRNHRITPEAVDAFRSADELTLHRALGLKPWEASPLDRNNPYLVGSPYSISWEKSRELRTELEAAR